MSSGQLCLRKKYKESTEWDKTLKTLSEKSAVSHGNLVGYELNKPKKLTLSRLKRVIRDAQKKSRKVHPKK